MSQDELERLYRGSDPIEQAIRATELLNRHQQESVEIARFRKEAIARAVNDSGLTYSEVARRIGLSKGRVTQIRQTAPPAERAFFGVGPLTVATQVREIEGRVGGVIAAEDTLSVDLLTETLTGMSFQVNRVLIPASGVWVPPSESIAICGPKASPTIREALQSDPNISFTEDSQGRWGLTDRASGARLLSPIDEGQTGKDVAYLGRVQHRGKSLMVIAGIHALGSIGAVHYLITHAPYLYKKAGNRNFSMAIMGSFDTLQPEEVEPVWAPRLIP